MLPKELGWFNASLQPIVRTVESHKLTYEFTWEIRRRQQHRQYCQWYARVAEQHRRELEQMRGDIDILGWVRRDRR